MKSSIRVIKKDGQSVNQETPEDKKPVEPNDRKVASTVKSWIAELHQRKRTHSHSFTALTVMILMTFAVAFGQTPVSTTVSTLTPNEQAIKVTISTTSGFLGKPTNRYKVGEQIPVTITMTNSAKDPLYTCVSSDRMASLIASYESEEALKVVRDLDATVESVLRTAANPTNGRNALT